jgi:leucyl/phenylalanyl-tRNA--protein transferase
MRLTCHTPHSDSDPPTVEQLLRAYRQGVFPMADPSTREIEWFTADPRAILPIESFHVPKSLARVVRQGRFTITSDTAFREVISACAHDRSAQNRSWISEEVITAYTRLHEAGHAHSVEAWVHSASHKGEGAVLVGGLYGVHIGCAFFGESMFSRPEQGGSNASKVCLVHLMNRLRQAGFTLVDTQFHNPHLEQFGLFEIPLKDYLARLKAATVRDCRWPF